MQRRALLWIGILMAGGMIVLILLNGTGREIRWAWLDQQVLKPIWQEQLDPARRIGIVDQGCHTVLIGDYGANGGEIRILDGAGRAVKRQTLPGGTLLAGGEGSVAYLQQGKLVCLDGNGNQLWTRLIPGQARGLAGLLQGKWMVIMRTQAPGANNFLEEKMVVLNAGGEIVRDYPVPSAVLSYAWTADGACLAVNTIELGKKGAVNHLYTFDSQGRIVWEKSVEGELFYRLAFSPDGRYLVGGDTQGLRCFDGTGKMVWARQTKGGVTELLTSDEGILVANYHVPGHQALRVFAAGTLGFLDYGGKTRWEHQLSGKATGLAVLGDNSIFATDQQHLYIFNPAGKILLEAKLPGKITGSQPNRQGDQLFTYTEKGQACCYQLQTGENSRKLSFFTP